MAEAKFLRRIAALQQEVERLTQQHYEDQAVSYKWDCMGIQLDEARAERRELAKAVVCVRWQLMTTPEMWKGTVALADRILKEAE